MYQEERIYQILKLLKEKKTMTNQEIMDYFHISRDTARRDIVRLVNENLAVRTHGGITLNDVHQIGSYQIRKQENEEIKNKIGKVAVSLIEEHKAVFFDTSTTIAALCQYVSQDIEAYSHSLDNIEILSNHCSCHMIGGKYFKKNRYIDVYKRQVSVLWNTSTRLSTNETYTKKKKCVSILYTYCRFTFLPYGNFLFLCI